MKISDALLPEFDQEMANTRKTLERIPEDKLAWKPHEKSMTLGRLAGHVAELPSFGATIMGTDSLNLSGGRQALVASSQRHVLETFDKNAAEARKAIASAKDEDWMKPWSLEFEGKTIFKVPRMAAVRSMMLSHMIHHRAQLGVYLRLNNVPVPSVYGPSADESAM